MHSTKQTLDQLRFSAKIDFITLNNPARRQLTLPSLDGTVKWSRGHHHRRFSIHDPSPQDIATLQAFFGPDALILEMEVAVDLKPVAPPDLSLLQHVMREFPGKRLCPTASSLKKFPRRAFRPSQDRAIYLGKSPCLPNDQMLLGSRTDPVQVKCYLKQSDQGLALQEHEAGVRVEVRLGQEELSRLGIPVLSGLSQFRFRKELMPYFHHYTPIARARKGLAPTRRRRETAINERIGQALLRLENAYDGAVRTLTPSCQVPASNHEVLGNFPVS